MKTNKPFTLITGLTLAALISSGCERARSNNTASADATVAVNGNAGLPPPAPATSATTNNSMAADSATTNQGRTTERANKDPEPKIGNGGNDFYVFTQARAVLNADSELKNSNIVIDIKNGSVTLTGNISNAEQKARAEQLVSAVEGVKSVKNQLSVSAAGTKR